MHGHKPYAGVYAPYLYPKNSLLKTRHPLVYEDNSTKTMIYHCVKIMLSHFIETLLPFSMSCINQISCGKTFPIVYHLN